MERLRPPLVQRGAMSPCGIVPNAPLMAPISGRDCVVLSLGRGRRIARRRDLVVPVTAGTVGLPHVCGPADQGDEGPARRPRRGKPARNGTADHPIAATPITDEVRKEYETYLNQYIIPALQKKQAAAN